MGVSGVRNGRDDPHSSRGQMGLRRESLGRAEKPAQETSAAVYGERPEQGDAAKARHQGPEEACRQECRYALQPV